MPLISRKTLEAREDRNLAPYAMKGAAGRGREHSEPEAAYRGVYQRDRDRVIHSTAFRRLEYKTQVFVNHEGDYYRTRLTHTLEVAQIARSVARALGANEDLAEAIALAHDLGHTPFGHSGEDELNSLMLEETGGKRGFEHNTHGLRVVTMLENQYPDFRGLNLTYEVRESIVKHRTTYDKPYHPDYEPEKRPLIESQIVDMADSIAFSNHDLDDGIKAEILDPGALDEIGLWREALGIVESAGKEMSERIRARQAVRALINMEVTDLIETSSVMLKEHGIDSPDKARSHEGYLITFSPEMHAKKNELQDILYRKVYKHYRVVRMQRKAARFLRKLFKSYINCPEQLPPDHQEWAAHEDVGITQAVADYIAGMTDRYALDEYNRLFNPFERV
jgi:dGTPase